MTSPFRSGSNARNCCSSWIIASTSWRAVAAIADAIHRILPRCAHARHVTPGARGERRGGAAASVARRAAQDRRSYAGSGHGIRRGGSVRRSGAGCRYVLLRSPTTHAPIVAEICRRLDGIPLAIELAAARVKVLTIPNLAQRLNERFKILTGGSRAALPRQKTLSALIDWSYDLLTPQEQMLFSAGGDLRRRLQPGCGHRGVRWRGPR